MEFLSTCEQLCVCEWDTFLTCFLLYFGCLPRLQVCSSELGKALIIIVIAVWDEIAEVKSKGRSRELIWVESIRT